MAEKIIIEVDLEKGDTSDAFKGIGKDAKKAGKVSGQAFGAGFKEFLAANLGAELIIASIRGVRNELGAVVEAGKSLEVIETQFKTMLGSTKAAQKQLEDLQSFAASTPFQLEGLSASTRQLLSFGVAQENIIPTLGKLGDLAAGVGTEISDLAIPFGRLVASQKLTLVELDKFADRGINLFQEFADSTGMSIGEVRDAVSNGKIPFEEFEKAITKLTSKGGTFFNSMDAQSKTLSGVISTLSDNMFNLRANLGKLFSPLIIASAKALTETIQDIDKSLSSISLDSAISGMVSFGKVIVNNVIMPFEIVFNVLSRLGDKVAEVFNSIKETVIGVFNDILTSLRPVFTFIGQEVDTFLVSAKAKIQQINDEEGGLLSGILDDTAFSDKLNSSLMGLQQFSESVKPIVQGINTSIESSVDGVTKKLSNMAIAANKIINNQFAKSISGGIQNVIQSMAKGEDVMQNFTKFVVGAFGDLAIQLGEFYIAQGIANLALIKVDPTSQIATGAALVALGGIMKSFASGGIGGAAGGDTSNAGFSTEAPSVVDDVEEEERQVGTTVNLTVEGSLVQQEELGAYIADITSESNQKNGNVVLNPRFA